MYTNNTIKNTLARLSSAIENLEIISHEFSIPIIRFLKSRSSANLSQLQRETNLRPAILRKQIIALEKAGILQTTQEAGVKQYTLDHYKMLRIQLSVKQLIDQPIQIINEY